MFLCQGFPILGFCRPLAVHAGTAVNSMRRLNRPKIEKIFFKNCGDVSNYKTTDLVFDA